MEELIARVAQAANLTPDAARNALGVVLNFLQKEAPEQTQAMLNDFPEAQELIASAGAAAPGGVAGVLGGILGRMGGAGGDLMALGGQLLGQGLSIEQARTVAGELVGFARREIGEERVDALLKAIPGLSQVL